MGIACLFLISGYNTMGVGVHAGVPVEKHKYKKYKQNKGQSKKYDHNYD